MATSSRLGSAGLNVVHCPQSVTSVAAIESSGLAWEMAQPRIGAASAPVIRAGLDGQGLDLADASMDAALSTFTMCTIPDLDVALDELARVLALVVVSTSWNTGDLTILACPMAGPVAAAQQAHRRRVQPQPTHQRTR